MYNSEMLPDEFPLSSNTKISLHAAVLCFHINQSDAMKPFERPKSKMSAHATRNVNPIGYGFYKFQNTGINPG